MKNLLLLVLLCLLAGFSQAQETIRRSLPWKAGQEIQLDLPFGDSIALIGWDKAEVQLLARVSINQGENNEVYWLKAEDKGNYLSIESGLDEGKMKQLKNCPDGSQYSGSNNRAVCVDISYELYVPRQAAMSLQTISADVNLRELAGDLQVKSISGDIDLAWPANQPVRLHLKSITGQVYTDLDLPVPSEPEMRYVGIDVETQIKAGGPEIELETISSNIFLRKML
jgi:hypothetical protein